MVRGDQFLWLIGVFLTGFVNSCSRGEVFYAHEDLLDMPRQRVHRYLGEPSANGEHQGDDYEDFARHGLKIVYGADNKVMWVGYGKIESIVPNGMLHGVQLRTSYKSCVRTWGDPIQKFRTDESFVAKWNLWDLRVSAEFWLEDGVDKSDGGWGPYEASTARALALMKNEDFEGDGPQNFLRLSRRLAMDRLGLFNKMGEVEDHPFDSYEIGLSLFYNDLGVIYMVSVRKEYPHDVFGINYSCSEEECIQRLGEPLRRDESYGTVYLLEWIKSQTLISVEISKSTGTIKAIGLSLE